jgi:hypothetical protein
MYRRRNGTAGSYSVQLGAYSVQLGHCNIQLMGIVLHSWWDLYSRRECYFVSTCTNGKIETADRNGATASVNM